MQNREPFFTPQMLTEAQRAEDDLGRLVSLSHAERRIRLDVLPPTGCGGDIEHYYHFLFDLLLPLGILFKEANAASIFFIEPFGTFTSRVKELYGGRIEILADDTAEGDMVRAPLRGMNPRCVALGRHTIEAFRDDILLRLGIESPRQPARRRSVLLERMPPDSYFRTAARTPGSGASRRSILNHEELSCAVRAFVAGITEFENLQAEELTFKEQVALLSDASLIIGQRGAGLANCIWMMRGSVVVEISHSADLKHFEVISAVKGHKYQRYSVAKEHVTVDIGEFLQFLERLSV